MNVDYRWLAVFIAQIGIGTFLYVQGDVDTAKFFWASALGQGVTANLKAKRS